MSRVRIYELAKEAGLKSKELADKLIDMGYPALLMGVFGGWFITQGRGRCGRYRCRGG